MSDLSFAEQLAAIFLSERRARHIVFPDVEGNLANLKRVYQLALVTNGAPDLQREKIRGANLAQYFDTILISGEVGVGKPDCRIFRMALDALAASPSETVMVGDSLTRDILGAQQAGLKGMWLNRQGNDTTSQVTPDVRIANLNQMLELLPTLTD